MMAAGAVADEAGGASTPTRALKRRSQRRPPQQLNATSKRLNVIGEKRNGLVHWF